MSHPANNRVILGTSFTGYVANQQWKSTEGQGGKQPPMAIWSPLPTEAKNLRLVLAFGRGGWCDTKIC